MKIFLAFGFIGTLLIGCTSFSSIKDPYPGSGGMHLGTPNSVDIQSGRAVFNLTKFSSLEIGRTTKQEVVDRLGAPAWWSTKQDGSSSMGYDYIRNEGVTGIKRIERVERVAFFFDSNFILTRTDYPDAKIKPCQFENEDDLYGLWEAIDVNQSYRIFRMEIDRDGQAILVHGMPTSDRINFFTFYLIDKLVVGKTINFVFKRYDKSSYDLTIQLEGKPYTFTGISELHGDIIRCNLIRPYAPIIKAELIIEPDMPNPVVRNLIFHKIIDKSLVEEIIEMEKNADEGADFIKKERANNKMN